MIRFCAERCGRWAQWVLLFPEPESKKPEYTTFTDPHVGEKTKRLVDRGRKFSIGPHLCTEHKEQMEKVPAEVERIFKFIGASSGDHDS